jgi:hypothetical protein
LIGTHLIDKFVVEMWHLKFLDASGSFVEVSRRQVLPEQKYHLANEALDGPGASADAPNVVQAHESVLERQQSLSPGDGDPRVGVDEIVVGSFTVGVAIDFGLLLFFELHVVAIGGGWLLFGQVTEIVHVAGGQAVVCYGTSQEVGQHGGRVRSVQHQVRQVAEQLVKCCNWSRIKLT